MDAITTDKRERDEHDVAVKPFAVQRECTRCDGQQHLLASQYGFGKYACETCQLTVGFDITSEPSEFLVHRGSPSHYTKGIYGSRLTGDELRM
jgi:hypothetical protein